MKRMSTVKITITVPVEIYDRIERDRGLVTRSKYISHLLKEILERKEGDCFD